MHTHSGRRNAGFTLVELLIAMGIIVTLMGLLMPTIHRARLGGMRTACRGNIGSIARACIAYAALPGGNALPNTQPSIGDPDEKDEYGNPLNLGPANWFEIDYYDPEDEDSKDPNDSYGNACGLWLLTVRGLLSPSVFFCPEARMRRGYLQAGPDDSSFKYDNGVATLSYSYISLVGQHTYTPEGADEEVDTPFRYLTTLDATGLTTKLGFSSSLVIVGDQNPRTTFNDNTILNDEDACSLNHHGVGQNVGAMDQSARWMEGTVETETEDDIYAADGAAVDSQSPVRGELGDAFLLP